METFTTCFSAVEDPRAGNARHDLLELMFVALAAVLCGAEDCTDMAAFARAKLGFLQEGVRLEHGAPSHDTFSRVFRLLAPEPFEAAFARFTATFAGALKGAVAIDGKTLRGAYERGCKTSPLHLVNIWAAEARLVIGQRLASTRSASTPTRAPSKPKSSEPNWTILPRIPFSLICDSPANARRHRHAGF